MEMTNRDKLERLHITIQRLLDDRRNGLPVEDDEDDRDLLSELLSQVESLKGNVDAIVSIKDDAKDVDAQRTGVPAEDIVKELRHVKRQNTITHWLLSIMIVVTVAWQLSEVSLILKVKKNLSNPFGSVRNLVTGFFKGKVPAAADGNEDKEKCHHPKEQDKNGMLPAIPAIKVPELPLIDLIRSVDDED